MININRHQGIMAVRFSSILFICIGLLQACSVSLENTPFALNPKFDVKKPSATSQVIATQQTSEKINPLKIDPLADNDRDGILDSVDKCLNTTRKAPVNMSGCGLDTDGDSVADYKDQCGGTPKGIKVDARGCGFDDDHDGVANYVDRCANTSADIAVDGYGCEWDSDGDGVVDSKDHCVGTPPDLQVEPMGCVLVQVVTLQGINFQSGSHMLNDGARTLLSSVADTLRRHPKLRVEIGGHTDNTGPVAINRELSVNRAKEAYNYLVQQGVNHEIMLVKGYAWDLPVSDNDSDQGRLENRRVEMRIVEVD